MNSDNDYLGCKSSGKSVENGKKRGLEEKADLSGIPCTGKVVIGLSGGADSAALVRYTANKIDRKRIVCVHVNHMLRGGEADRDEEFCKKLCGELNIKILVFHEDIRTLAKDWGIGEEEAGRKTRYARFQEAAGDCGVILTAHNADDNAETVIMNIARGTGMKGLRGIPFKRGNILRPILRVSREEIEDYCRENSLCYVNDSSNDTDDYDRNRVRHRIMPVMKGLNPQFLSAVSGMGKRLGADYDFILGEAKKLLETARDENGLRTKVLVCAHESLRSRALMLFFAEQGAQEPSAFHIEYALEHLENGMKMSLPGGLLAECSCGILMVHKAGKPEKTGALTDNGGNGSLQPWRIKLNFGENSLPFGKKLILLKVPIGIFQHSAKINSLLFKSALDCDTIVHNLYARPRRAGDRFAAAGRGHSKSMKNLFAEMGVPVWQRNEVVMLETGGQLVFVEGMGAAEHFQVTDKTKTVLMVSCKDENAG